MLTYILEFEIAMHSAYFPAPTSRLNLVLTLLEKILLNLYLYRYAA